MVVTLCWPQTLAWRPPYVVVSGWSSLPLVAALLLLAGTLSWGLYTAAPRVLMYGVIAAMTVLLGYGITLHNRRYNEIWDFPALAAAVERHAHGGAVGVFGGRWFALDYYLGRRVFSTHTLAQFSDYVSRPDHPIVVTNERTWNDVRASADLDVSALEERSVGGQTLVIVRARGELPPVSR
jgi:hypothetical protein